MRYQNGCFGGGDQLHRSRLPGPHWGDLHSCSLSESNLVTIKVRDHGCGIADVQKAMEPLFTTGGSERAGLGFAVMQELMDEVRVTSRAGGGTTVRLRRRLSQKAR